MPLRSNGPVNGRPAFSGGNLYHVARAVAFQAPARLCPVLLVAEAPFCPQIGLKVVLQTGFKANCALRGIFSHLKCASRCFSCYF